MDSSFESPIGRGRAQTAGASLGLADDALVPTGPEHYPRDALNRPELYQSEYRLLATYSDWLRV